jgi:hypothetical protein
LRASSIFFFGSFVSTFGAFGTSFSRSALSFFLLFAAAVLSATFWAPV